MYTLKQLWSIWILVSIECLYWVYIEFTPLVRNRLIALNYCTSSNSQHRFRYQTLNRSGFFIDHLTFRHPKLHVKLGWWGDLPHREGAQIRPSLTIYKQFEAEIWARWPLIEATLKDANKCFFIFLFFCINCSIRQG